MLLFVTTAPNDDDLARVLGSFSVLRCPIPTDIAFWGVGDNDAVLKVGIERKKIGDLCQCINDGRYLHQLQVAAEDGMDVLCLVVEGRVRSSPDDGLLEIPVWGVNLNTGKRAELWQPVKPTMTYSRFDQYLTELEWLAGVIVKRTENVAETASVIKALYANFQTPPGKHDSLKKFHITRPPQVLLTRPSLMRRVAKELPGIEWERSVVIDRRFRTLHEMCHASEEDWRELEGIGKKTAQKLVQALNGGANGAS